jgi:flagellar biosynthesis GTPase FlhF
MIMKSSTSKSSVITQILLAAVAIAIGYLLLFSKSAAVITLCQILCGGIVAIGIASIASFFLAGDFRRIDRYGFALGTLLVLMGLIGLIRINDVTANFEFFTGLVSLILGVLVLQGTVQMKVLDYPIWILNLVISLASIAGAFCVLSGITIITGKIAGFSSWVLLICGCACLFSMLVTWICILLAGRREKKMEAEKAAAAERAEQARIEAEEKAKQEEQARKVAEAAQAQAIEQARREAAALAKAEAEREAQAQRDEMAAKAAEAKAQAAEEAKNEFPPVENPELVFGSDQGDENAAQ